MNAAPGFCPPPSDGKVSAPTAAAPGSAPCTSPGRTQKSCCDPNLSAVPTRSAFPAFSRPPTTSQHFSNDFLRLHRRVAGCPVFRQVWIRCLGGARTQSCFPGALAKLITGMDFAQEDARAAGKVFSEFAITRMHAGGLILFGQHRTQGNFKTPFLHSSCSCPGHQHGAEVPSPP